jgi:glyoxylase-like metal-dependent hydrolase (beta-lactamase superfamily II)
MKMHVLSGGRIRMKRKVYIPDAAGDETIDLPVMCFLLKHPQGNVLFDTGCHPAVAKDPVSRWGGMAKMMTLVSPADENLIGGLAAIGVGTDDIDVVVNSHFHTDHCGCNEFFRRATVVCHARELAAASAADAEKTGFLERDWKHANRFDAIEGQRDLFGDGRIVLVPLPGHTPGTTGALVSLERSGRYLLASDTAALRANLERDHNPRQTWNAELASRSMAEIRRIEAGGATVVFGHDAAQWDTLKKGADCYD